jgi:hypothetical protein
MMTSQKAQSKNSNLTPLLLLVVSGFLVFLAAEQDRQGKPQTLNLKDELTKDFASGLPPQEEFNSRVNQHLFLIDQKIYWDQERQRLENLKSKFAAEAESALKNESYSVPTDLDFEADARERHLIGDLNRDRKKIESYLGPQSKIQSQVLEDQALLQHQERMRREYAEQFVRNARAGGYEVVLDDNFNIKSVKPIRKGNDRLPGSLLSKPYGAQ